MPDYNEVRKFYKKLLMETQPFTDEPAMSMLVSYIKDIEAKATEKAISVIHDHLTKRWFTLSNIKVMIPSTEIDSICNGIRAEVNNDQ